MFRNGAHDARKGRTEIGAGREVLGPVLLGQTEDLRRVCNMAPLVHDARAEQQAVIRRRRARARVEHGLLQFVDDRAPCRVDIGAAPLLQHGALRRQGVDVAHTL